MKAKKLEFDFEKLYALTEKSQSTLRVEEELYLLSEIIGKNFDLKLSLENIRYNNRQKAEICLAILPPAASPITREIIELLSSRGLLGKIKELSEGFTKYIAEKKQLAFAQIKTVVPLSDQLKTKIETTLAGITKRTVVLKQKIAPEIMGGFFISILGGPVIDATIKRKLGELQNKIIGAEA